MAFLYQYSCFSMCPVNFKSKAWVSVSVRADILLPLASRILCPAGVLQDHLEKGVVVGGGCMVLPDQIC